MSEALRESLPWVVRIAATVAVMILAAHTIARIKKGIPKDKALFATMEFMGFLLLCYLALSWHYHNGLFEKDGADKFNETVIILCINVGFVLASLLVYALVVKMCGLDEPRSFGERPRGLPIPGGKPRRGKNAPATPNSKPRLK